MSVAGPSNLSSAQGKRRPRLPSAGVAIMEEFLKETGVINPSTDQKAILLERILAIPGCQQFDLSGVTSWFSRRRYAKRPKTQKLPYGKLNKTGSIQHLAVLSQGQPYPPPDVLVNTWATLLGADKENILAWLFDNQEGTIRCQSPMPHLPTPVSTSPEPASEYQFITQLPFYKRDPLHSPVVPSPTLPRFCIDPFHPQDSQTLSDFQLAKVIAQVPKLEQNLTTYPINPEQFEEMFAPYQRRMEAIICKNVESLKMPP